MNDDEKNEVTRIILGISLPFSFPIQKLERNRAQLNEDEAEERRQKKQEDEDQEAEIIDKENESYTYTPLCDCTMREFFSTGQ